MNVRSYLEKIDFTLLTSISEGQPLAVLEAMAAGRPAVTTDVGSCQELIMGPGDDFGPGPAPGNCTKGKVSPDGTIEAKERGA